MSALTSLTVLIGPNGSGKSTIFDVFSFLSDCFQLGLRHACETRGRLREMRSRGSAGPIAFELKYRERPQSPLMTYHLSIDEGARGPEVIDEWLDWGGEGEDKPFRLLDFHRGVGRAVSGDAPHAITQGKDMTLRSGELLAVNTLGQLSEYPRVATLREFMSDWYISHLSVDSTRELLEARSQERLSRGGENLPNVIQYLKENHPKTLDQIYEAMRARIPRLERVETERGLDGRLQLHVKDAPFEQPVLSRFASEGTLKLLSYLTLLYAPNLPSLMGIEEPENFLHPRLLTALAEECRAASERSQLLMTSHSPFLLNAMRAEDVRLLYRDEGGFAQLVRVSDLQGVPELVRGGGSLGYLWMEGHFGVGDPLVNHGSPRARRRG